MIKWLLSFVLAGSLPQNKQQICLNIFALFFF